MAQPKFLTIGQLADELQQPEWKVRRIVDSLGQDIPRAGLYRLVPRSLIPTVAASLADAIASMATRADQHPGVVR